MAYGNEETCLENFDKIIPDEVFKEVTSITLDEFRFLRDGGDYVDAETGDTKHFDGHLFDPIAIAYILGFSDEIKIEKHNLRQFDTLPAVQAGNLEQKLDEIYAHN